MKKLPLLATFAYLTTLLVVSLCACEEETSKTPRPNQPQYKVIFYPTEGIFRSYETNDFRCYDSSLELVDADTGKKVWIRGSWVVEEQEQPKTKKKSTQND